MIDPPLPPSDGMSIIASHVADQILWYYYKTVIAPRVAMFTPSVN